MDYVLMFLIGLAVYVVIEQELSNKAAIKRRKKYFDEYERKNKKH